jgi:tRNA (guanine-N7-)-methyltransferase
LHTKSSRPLRTVRSYVRRGRPLTQYQDQNWDNLWPIYGLASDYRLDGSLLFNREAPRILEIGYGMGHGLLALATENPGTDYVGIEVHRPGVAALLLGAGRAKLTNIRTYCADAVQIMENCISPESLDEVLLFFPDPWPKKRHHKRRLVQPAFVALVGRCLKPGGKFHMATDWEDYAKHMIKVMAQMPEFAPLLGEAKRPSSKYAERGQRLGHNVWDLIFNKNSEI